MSLIPTAQIVISSHYGIADATIPWRRADNRGAKFALKDSKFYMNGMDISRGCRGYEETLHRNWCGNVRFGGTPLVPESVEQLQEAVRLATPPIRVVGRGHSFSPLAECVGGSLLCLARLNRVLDFRAPTSMGSMGSITVEGGTTYSEIARFLGRQGALRNLPSCPQFTVAGAIATATHGSGVTHQNLAADVTMLEFVAGDGSLICYEDGETATLLEGLRVHLGCLGVVSRLTLVVCPFYEVETFCYIDVPLAPMIENLPALWTTCDSLSVWTSGFGRGPGAGTCWMVFRHFCPHWKPSAAVPEHTPPQELLLHGGSFLQGPVNRYCTDPHEPVTITPTGKRAWHDALTQTLHEGQETSMTTTDIQAEFFVALQHAQAAIRAVWGTAREWSFSSPWGATGEPMKGLVDAMEFRQVKGDGAWLSPQHIDSLGIHISFNSDPGRRAEVEACLHLLEAALEPFDARAHWGKLAPLTTAPARLEELYDDRLRCFRALCGVHDPSGKFRNVWVRRALFTERARL